MPNPYRRALDEIGAAFVRIDEGAVERAVEALAEAVRANQADIG